MKFFLLLILCFISCSKNSKFGNSTPQFKKIEYAGIQVQVPANSKIVAKRVSDLAGSVTINSNNFKEFSVLQWVMSDGENFESPEEIRELFQAFLPDSNIPPIAESILINDQKGTKLVFQNSKDDIYLIMWQCISGRIVMFLSNSEKLVDLNIKHAKSPTRELKTNKENLLPAFILPDKWFYTLSNSMTASFQSEETDSFSILVNVSHISSNSLKEDKFSIGIFNLLGVQNFKFTNVEKTSFHGKEITVKNSIGSLDEMDVFMKSFFWFPEKKKKYFFFSLSFKEEDSVTTLSSLNSAEFIENTSISEVYKQHIKNMLSANSEEDKLRSISFLKRIQPAKDRVEVLVDSLPRIEGLNFDQTYELLRLIPDYLFNEYSDKIFTSLTENGNNTVNAMLSRIMYLNEESNFDLVSKTLQSYDLKKYDLSSFIDETASEDIDYSLFPVELLTEFSKLNSQMPFYRLLQTIFNSEFASKELTKEAIKVSKSILDKNLPSLLEEKPRPESFNYFRYIETLNILNSAPKGLIKQYLPLLEKSKERQAVFYELILKSTNGLLIDEALVKKALADDVNFYQLYIELKKSESLSLFSHETLSLKRLIQSQVKSQCEIGESKWPLNNFKQSGVIDSKKGKIYEFSFSNNDQDFVVLSGPHKESIRNFSDNKFIRLFPVDKGSEKEQIYKTYNEEMEDYFVD